MFDRNKSDLLVRAHTVLSNMALENELHWWEFWKPRWPISHEPLRNDARNVIKEIESYWETESERQRNLRRGD